MVFDGEDLGHVAGERVSGGGSQLVVDPRDLGKRAPEPSGQRAGPRTRPIALMCRLRIGLAPSRESRCLLFLAHA